jgi:arsenite methyltransferase
MKFSTAFTVLLASASSQCSAFAPNSGLSRGKSVSILSATKDTPLFVDQTERHSSVSEYYGTTLQSSGDLKTNACVTGHVANPTVTAAIKQIHPAVLAKYYGCGFCTPDLLDGMTVLDLGCGAGRDVYIASTLVGPNGRVIGVDMTEEQLATAREYQPYHAEKFGFDNVEFHHGLIEKLDEIDSLTDGSVDIIISNCVINLCPDKEAVLKNCHRLLKEGGELYFSDVYSNRRVPQSLRDDEVLWGECLSGALYWNDFHNLGKACGFKDPRLVEDAPITVNNKEVQNMIESQGHKDLEFFSATYRLMKLDSLEPFCEDYGQAVIYKGTIPRAESGWSLDDHHYMETGKVFPVCGNTYNMLKQTRFEDHFDFIGDFSKHYGIFDGCGTSIPYTSASGGVQGSASSAAGGCC